MAATVTPLPTPSRALSQLPPRIVFFDGVCSFCDGAVRWLADRDPEARLHFAPLQGETAETVRRAFPGRFPDDIDTLVYLAPGDGPGGRQISLRSQAVFELWSGIGGVWAIAALLRWLPRAVTDWAYRRFAENRYRLFGTLDACDLPTPEDRARLLP